MSSVGWRVVRTATVLGLASAAFLATDCLGTRIFVVNVTDSLPLGVYMRTFEEPIAGTTVRFPLPAVMQDYIAPYPAWVEFFRRGALLKPVVGEDGDVICRSARGDFSLNGRVLGVAPSVGPDGRALPSWGGCNRLGDGQIAVFSGLIPDSFDSRLYGAVSTKDATTYRLVWEFKS